VIIFDSHAQHLLHHVQHVAAFREAGSALEIRTPEAAAVGFSGRRSPVHAQGLRRQALPL